jgi:hypothetical protein
MSAADRADVAALQPTTLLPDAPFQGAVKPAVAADPSPVLPFWTAGDLIRRCHLLRC